MKKIIRIIVILLIALFIELFIINSSYFFNLIFSNKTSNVEYPIEKMEFINWDRTPNNEYISKFDPIIVANNIDVFIKDIKVYYEVDSNLKYIDLFYTSSSDQSFSGDLMIRKEDASSPLLVNINEHVHSLRVDLGDDANTKLSNFKIIVNPIALDFSISRVIAVIILCYGSLILFSFQKNQEYF